MIQTEKAVLAIVIFENSLLPILMANAERSLFSYDFSKIAFDEIEDLYKKGQPFDFVILADKIKNKIEMPVGYISSLMDCLTSTNL